MVNDAAKRNLSLLEVQHNRNGSFNHGSNLGSNIRSPTSVHSGRGSVGSHRRQTVINQPGKSLLKGDAMRRVQILAGVGRDREQSDYYSKHGGMSQASDAAIKSGGAVPHHSAVIMQSHGTESFEHRQSLIDARADGSMQGPAGTISHSGTIVSRSMTDKIAMLERQDSVEKPEIEEALKKSKPRPKWKI